MGERPGPIARWGRAAVAAAALACGLAAVGVASRHGASTTFAGRSAGAAAAELAAGWALVAGGVAAWTRRPGRAAGALAVCAAVTWFAGDVVGWQTGPGALRIIALAATGVTAAAVVQLAVATPPGRGSAARAVVVATWSATAVVGLGRIALYDPLADPHCVAYCAPNPLLVRGERGLGVGLDAVASATAILAALAAAALVARRTVRADAAERVSVSPAAVAAVAFLLAGAVRAAALVADSAADPARPVLLAAFAAQAAALAALGAGLLWASDRERRGVRAIRRLAREIADEPPPGHLERTLARATGDPSLRVVYPSGDGTRWIDGEGRAVAAPSRRPGRAVTAIQREGRTVATVLHDPAALDGGVLEHEIGTAARLAVDNERLRAEARARLRELRGSRARIVATGDAERRRLERDLHDGAQQRLVGLSMALGLARGGLDADRAALAAPRLDAADASLRAALADLRELAHGIHPVQLSAEGLAAALETLALRARVPVRLGDLPAERLAAPVETAAYVLVDEVLARAERRAGPAIVDVAATVVGGVLEVAVHDRGERSAERAREELLGVGDRVGALDGTLEVEPGAEGVVIRAELPCA